MAGASAVLLIARAHPAGRFFELAAAARSMGLDVLLEVLEHLDDDLDALERIPPGLPVVFSVPNFWSRAHVRRFLQPRDVFDRYGPLLDFDAWQVLAFPAWGRRIHVFRATRRSEIL